MAHKSATPGYVCVMDCGIAFRAADARHKPTSKIQTASSFPVTSAASFIHRCGPSQKPSKPQPPAERIRGRAASPPGAASGAVRPYRTPEAMERNENAAHSAPPLQRPRGKRKALAELPTNEWRNTDGGCAPRPSKPRTRSAARAEDKAEEARKAREASDVARGADVARLLDPKKQDAGAAQAAVAPYLEDIGRYLRSLEVRVSPLPSFFPGNEELARGQIWWIWLIRAVNV